jgi:uncharacterized protein YpbB
MGKTRVQKYGGQILDIVDSYCKKQGIKQQGESKEDKISTREITFKLFKEGVSVKEISKERNLTQGTIESHLVSFVASGDIDVLDLIPLKRYNQIVKSIENTEFKSLTDLKERVGKPYTYMELRMVLKSL